MHELSVMSYLLDEVVGEAQRAHATRVTAINLVIGERAGIVDEALQYCFGVLTSDTLAHGAQLNVTRTRMRFACRACASEYAPALTEFGCPACGVVGQLVSDGTELLIESIEVEQ